VIDGRSIGMTEKEMRSLQRVAGKVTEARKEMIAFQMGEAMRRLMLAEPQGMA
jgi:hypothetical protein